MSKEIAVKQGESMDGVKLRVSIGGGTPCPPSPPSDSLGPAPGAPATVSGTLSGGPRGTTDDPEGGVAIAARATVAVVT